jgi:hypothetical protein
VHFFISMGVPALILIFYFIYIIEWFYKDTKDVL